MILLNENQILYIYSSLAQVIGALLGLTIAGYSIIDAKIQAIGASDDTITEYAENLRNDYFSALLYIIIFGISDIILCLITLAVYDDIFSCCLPFFLTESILLFLLIMVEVLRFALYLNPFSIKNKGSQEKHILDSEHQSSAEYSTILGPFITYFNMLENVLKQYACDLIRSPQSIKRLQLSEALDILLSHEIIDRRAYDLIQELRRYRNALVHSFDDDKKVNPAIYEELEDIYKLIADIYESKDEKDNYQKKIRKLYEYTNTCVAKETETEIIAYLKEHPSATISEIAEGIGYSKESTICKLNRLQAKGLIQKRQIGKDSQWIVC